MLYTYVTGHINHFPVYRVVVCFIMQTQRYDYLEMIGQGISVVCVAVYQSVSVFVCTCVCVRACLVWYLEFLFLLID